MQSKIRSESFDKLIVEQENCWSSHIERPERSITKYIMYSLDLSYIFMHVCRVWEPTFPPQIRQQRRLRVDIPLNDLQNQKIRGYNEAWS